MPYKLVHHQHSHLVDLVNKHSGKVYAYNTTEERAKKQIQAIELHKNLNKHKY